MKTVLVVVLVSAGSCLRAEAADHVFVGEGGSGSGKLSEAKHWDPEGVPTGNVKFTRNGTIGTDSDVSVGLITVDYANAALLFDLGGHAFTAGGGMNMGVSDASSRNALEIANGTFRLTGHFYANMAGSHSTVRVSEGGRLSIPSHSLRLCGYESSHSNSFYVAKNGSADISTLLVGDEGPWGYAEINGATNVSITTANIGKAVKCSDCKLVVRDSKSVRIETILVGADGPRAHLLVTNVTDFTCSQIQVGTKSTVEDASAEVYLDSTCTPSLRMDGTNGRLLYDAGGAANSGSLFSTFPLGGGNQRLELRNYAYTCTDVIRWRDKCARLDFVIGKGSTVNSTFSAYSPFYLEGNPGTRFAIDGGTMDLTGAASSVALQYCTGDTYGGSNLLEVVNGGTFNCAGKDVYWGVADSGNATKTGGNALRVANGGLMAFKDLRLFNSSNKIVVSNATVSADTVNVPYSNAGWATNNVVRFEGDAPSVSLTGYFNVYQSVDEATQKQKSETILEFVLPETRYAAAPFEADHFNLFGNTRLRIDTSAYADRCRWMTILKAGKGTIDIAGGNTWTNLVSEVPEACEVRLTADRKELQIRVRGKWPFGFMILFR